MFDVDQVEVLKGPQGTLFGHNATGGAIVIRTRQPTDSVGGYARLTYGRFDQVKFEGAYGGPINDTLAVRVSLYSDKYGPYTKNIYPGDGESNDDTQAGRIQLRYHPNDDIAFNLSVFASRSIFSTSPHRSPIRARMHAHAMQHRHGTALAILSRPCSGSWLPESVSCSTLRVRSNFRALLTCPVGQLIKGDH